MSENINELVTGGLIACSEIQHEDGTTELDCTEEAHPGGVVYPDLLPCVDPVTQEQSAKMQYTDIDGTAFESCDLPKWNNVYDEWAREEDCGYNLVELGHDYIYDAELDYYYITAEYEPEVVEEHPMPCSVPVELEPVPVVEISAPVLTDHADELAATGAAYDIGFGVVALAVAAVGVALLIKARFKKEK